TLAAADKATEMGRGPISLRTKLVALPGRFTILGFEDKTENGRRVPGPPKDYSVTYVGGVESTLDTDRAEAYLIPAKFTNAIDNLKRHGITVETLPAEKEMTVEVSKVTKLSQARRDFQKHRMN